MGDFRAKDADRDRFVELIQAAYADGQIGDADRELRVGRALAAETVDELEGLTRDLQRPQGHVPPAAPTRSSSRLPSRPPSRSRRAGGVLVGLGVFVALVVAGVTGVVALAFFAVSGEPESVTSQGTEVAPVPIEEVTEVTKNASFRMTPPQVRQFLRAYEKKFGTLDAWEVGFYPDRVQVQVPVSKVRKRFERWSWDGTWRQDSEASAVTGPQKFVTLGHVDVRRMFANIARARRTLDVPDGRLTHVLVNDWGDGPSVNIYIGNTYNETGYLATTPAGVVVRAFPYDA
jgi:hypothetical protein